MTNLNDMPPKKLFNTLGTIEPTNRHANRNKLMMIDSYVFDSEFENTNIQIPMKQNIAMIGSDANNPPTLNTTEMEEGIDDNANLKSTFLRDLVEFNGQHWIQQKNGTWLETSLADNEVIRKLKITSTS